MKIFFLLLLLANIGFAVFQWLMPYDYFAPGRQLTAVAEQLKLLEELDDVTYLEQPVVKPDEPVTEKSAKKPVTVAEEPTVEDEPVEKMETAMLTDIENSNVQSEEQVSPTESVQNFHGATEFESAPESEPVPEIIEELRSEPEPVINIAAPLCYTLGPFVSEELAREAAAQFNRQNIQVDSRSSPEKEYMGMMVYIDGHENRLQAIETANSLKDKGISDYIIVNEPGKNNALSLGVFSLKKNADRRLQKISALGYPVKTEARYRNRRIYWLDYTQAESEGLQPLVEKLKKEQGLSRISRQCS